jgi:hypothetical protein
MKLMNAWRDRPIFICGHPKSGTTLLRALLDSHPQLLVYPDETFFFRGFLPEIRNLSFDEKLSLAQRYILHFFTSPLTSEVENPIDGRDSYVMYAEACEAMRQILKPESFRHNGDLLYAAIYAFGQVHKLVSSETLYWVEKTPYNEHFASIIYAWWPEARCIQVVRDPRDNYATYHRKHSGLAVEEFTESWKASLKAGIHNLEKFGTQRYLIIRYEELIQNPKGKLGEIIAFLGIRDADTLRTPTNKGVLWEGNSMFADRFSAISSKPLGRWKSVLSSEEIGVIELVCGNWMKRMGYPLANRPSLKPGFRVLSWKAKQTARLPGELVNTVRKRFGVLPQ